MKIVFVHTPMPRVFLEERREYWHAFDVRYHATHPKLRPMRQVMWELPHWMHWLAGTLRERGYTKFQAIDLYTPGCPPDGIDVATTREVLKSAEGDAFLFSPMTPNIGFAIEIAEVAKDLYPDCRTLFGGVASTPLAEQLMTSHAVDFVVAGRGEYALPDLIDALAGRRSLDEVKSLLYRAPDGTIRRSDHIYPWMPVHALPSPVIDLFPPERGEDLRYIRQVYALGCPFTCSFCTIQTIGRRANYFPIQRVLAEIDAYRAYYGQHHNIYFGDETFTAHPGRTLAICEALEERGDIHYDIQTRVDLLENHKVLAALSRSGCRWIEIGIETLNTDDHRRLKGGRGSGQLVSCLERLKDHGLHPCSLIVNGLPAQTLDDMRRTIDGIAELLHSGLLTASYLFGLVPYPGSMLFSQPEQNGIELLHKNFSFYHEELLPVYRTRYADPDDMHRVLLEGIKCFGQAMRSGVTGPAEEMGSELYGTFWNQAHS